MMLIIGLALAGCGRGDDGEKGGKGRRGGGDGGPDAEKSEPAPVPVEVAVATLREIGASYAGTATLSATGEAMVTAKTSGVALRVLAEEGDPVKRGQALAKLDSDRAALEVKRSRAMLAKLEAEYARSRELLDRKLIAADTAEKQRYDIATQRTALELAQLELSHTTVVAPISGVVAERMLKAGNLVTNSEPLFRIVDTTKLEAVLNVPEREIGQMKAGLPVTLMADALAGQSFSGVIDRVAPVVDAASGTFRVTARFDGSDGRLKPGMFGRLLVVHDQRANALTIPRGALLGEADGEPAVFVVVDGTAKRTPIETGHLSGEFVEVTAGLAAGERVVTAGKVAIRDGSKVQVIGDETASRVAAAPAAAGPVEGTADDAQTARGKDVADASRVMKGLDDKAPVAAAARDTVPPQAAVPPAEAAPVKPAAAPDAASPAAETADEAPEGDSAETGGAAAT